MRRLWLIFSQTVTVAVAALFVVTTFKPQWLARGRVAERPGPAASAPGSGFLAGDLAAAARAASPAVVSVSAGKAPGPAADGEDPTFRYFFGDRGQSPAPLGFGSGVIVSAQGVLLTNNHVVEGARDITVRLSDGREAAAEVVGTDPETDLAVLRIQLDKLPAITLGRPEALQVGDTVLAIGNPFNVGQTVTAGIVSALGRDGLGLSTFEKFIQTDAAINPGNSGGALVDGNGHLVGINTAIFSRSGGSLGIGFAIPVDVAQQVMEALLRDGQVVRGWIGVETRELTAEFIEQFQLPLKGGVLITGVLQDGPAARGGMKPGDVVTAVAGRDVANVPQLLSAVAALKPGSGTQVAVQRGGKKLELTLDVAQRPRQRVAANGR